MDQAVGSGEEKTMSIYDNRTISAYRPLGTEHPYRNRGVQFCDNPHILKWWTPEHDKMLSESISKARWTWVWSIAKEIESITAPEVIKEWKDSDPICLEYGWHGILMCFANGRAEKLGLTDAIRKPEWKICPLCNNEFVEDSLPLPLIRRLGINNIDFCSPCLRDTVLQDNNGKESLSREEILTYVVGLTTVLKRIPSSSFGTGMYDLYDLKTDERLAVLKLLARKPSLQCIKNEFGSWFNALIAAKVLEEDALRTSRGTKCLAVDGHICYSLGEKTIDDLLHYLGIAHDKEPIYPEGKYRADFIVRDVFIEYLGLAGNTDYDAKTILKQGICKRNDITLILIYPRDLSDSERLEKKLTAGIGLGSDLIAVD